MSFILDALKKAESERSRQSGPVLMDVRVAPPRRRLPGWAWVLGAVLLANLLVLAWLLLRRPAPQAATAPAAPALSAPAVAATPPAVTPQVAAAPAYAVPAPALAAPAQTDLPPPLPPMAAAPEVVDVENLPTYQELVGAGISLPALALNLHVYDVNPANRYVLLNSLRLREGDSTPDGIKLETITARGAVLNQRGRRFLLTAGG